MPAQKRSLAESLDEGEASQLYHQRHAKRSPELRGEEQREEEDELEETEDQGRDEEETGRQHQEEQDYENSMGSPSSRSEEPSEYLFVELPEIRKEVQCPICLGIIKKTRTVMECLHRFCRECIDKSMRIGNNECPACRTHCASRRSLRDDPNYDSLIAAFYPDIEKYEKEELEFREEEKNRNEQIQASIAIVVQRQSETLVKRRNKDKSVGTPLARSQRNHRNSRRQNQGILLRDNEEENGPHRENNSSSSDELCIELRRSKQKKGARVRPSQPSSSMASPDCMESEASNPQNLTWGRGGFRSHTRHGGGSNNGKSSGNNRLSKLVDYLQSLDENTDELNIHLVLVSLDKESTPSLEQPHLCCQPTLSVKQLCEYVAGQTPLAAEEVQIFVVKGGSRTSHDNMSGEDSSSDYELTTPVVDPSKDELEILLEDETVAGLRSKCMSKRNHLILAYRRKDNTT